MKHQCVVNPYMCVPMTPKFSMPLTTIYDSKPHGGLNPVLKQVSQFHFIVHHKAMLYIRFQVSNDMDLLHLNGIQHMHPLNVLPI